ncbi:DUF397 domain-containing protein [Actinomadura sp. 7K507]|uniref:DUF397 domain-containing protein n=1 Tax=Actinomadura sp. 7K507 TaxID=2530365 RepID=UPI001042F271|nr:DUF397 domain-containing protein [Actinomadura sp. 7K507]TDC97499.1 DUF397 domain-containing protein [Actinomadura sp. 7K507]
MREHDLHPARWRTSSYSSGQGTECVEVAKLRREVAARDSKDPSGPVLGFSRGEWRVFLDEVKSGALDLA